ncbi:glycosyltransferase family 4 protein [Litoreibacter sp.]|nr:glycosyltransferase family 4 protein [Litoreibacter sp.]
MPELYVTNFNRNFTGVSATIAGLIPAQSYLLQLVGEALPGCSEPISRARAFSMSRERPANKPFAIWHVRRNTEMRAGIWARDVLRRPIKLVFTSAAQRRHSALPRWLISKMDAVIATTDLAAEFVPHVRAVVPHGVDTHRFQPAKDRAEAWAALGYGGARGIATVGRIRPEKGTDRFVEAMLQVLPQHADVTALVIGRAGSSDRAFLDGLKSKVTAAGLSKRVLFVGEIDGARMPELMRGLSLLCPLPRYEGYGMTPLEAMASGVPFVGTDVGYFRQFSYQGQSGQVVEPQDGGTAIGALLFDQVKLEKMSLAAQNVARDHYGIETEAAGIARVYEDLWSAG